MRKFYTSNNGFIEIDDWHQKCWINVEAPNEDDIRFITDELEVPQSFLDDIFDDDERPRFDKENNWLLTILRIPVHVEADTNVYSTVTMGVVTQDNLIVTICKKQTNMWDEFITHTRKRHISVDTSPDFILHLIYTSTSWYLKYLKEISNSVSYSIRYLKKSVRNEDLISLMTLQKSLVYFNTSIRGNSTLVDRLNKLFADDCDPDLLEDVDIELQQAQNTVNVYMEILDSTTDTLASLISNNVNQIMKKMTSVSIILMLPTLIASFYGMNVAVAYANSKFAFAGIIIFSIALALIIYFILRKIKWI